MWPRRRTAETIDQPSRPVDATAYQPENWGWNAPPYEPSSDAPRRSAACGYATVGSIVVAAISAVRFIVSLAHGGAPLGTTGWASMSARRTTSPASITCANLMDELLIGSRQDNIDDLYLINVLVDTGVPIHAVPYFTSTGAVNSL